MHTQMHVHLLARFGGGVDLCDLNALVVAVMADKTGKVIGGECDRRHAIFVRDASTSGRSAYRGRGRCVRVAPGMTRRAR
ncbi:hypothetical protein GCM10023191_026440 [Actinoallomurus oryzae]|jgi:hypothetical protein|uniref:Uncharacterized protein n=1 Tax=Actinoallomurus oryzae TaxID=502180 RepID=A0ABP8PRB1_9ACTN